MSDFFRFKKHENEELRETLRQRIKNINETEKRIQEIDIKKKRLFDSKEIDYWQINNKNYFDYIADFDKIKDIMLPDETFLQKSILKQCNFINKHVLYEYFNFIKNEDFYIRNNFSNFNEKVTELLKSEDVLWNIFDKDSIGVIKKDYSYTLKSK